MAAQLFTNNAISLLGQSIVSTDNALSVFTGTGSYFPQPTGDGSDFFLITLEDQGATVREIIQVGARSGDIFTSLLRGQEGTTARSWNVSPGNDIIVDHRITAGTINRLKSSASGSIFPKELEVKATTSGAQAMVATENFDPSSTSLFINGLKQSKSSYFISNRQVILPSELNIIIDDVLILEYYPI